MSKALDEASAKVPADPRALAQLRRHIELGELEEVKAALPGTPRYLVTFMRSQTGVPVRSATVVSVTNQAQRPNLVTVSWFLGFSNNSSPVGTASMIIPPGPADPYQGQGVITPPPAPPSSPPRPGRRCGR